jgi:hypothetical protein
MYTYRERKKRCDHSRPSLVAHPRHLPGRALPGYRPSPMTCPLPRRVLSKTQARREQPAPSSPLHGDHHQASPRPQSRASPPAPSTSQATHPLWTDREPREEGAVCCRPRKAGERREVLAAVVARGLPTLRHESFPWLRLKFFRHRLGSFPFAGGERAKRRQISISGEANAGARSGWSHPRDLAG